MTDYQEALAAARTSTMPATTYTSLAAIRAHEPCSPGWEKLLAHLSKTEADDVSLALTTILESNGLDDALWALRSLSDADIPKVRLFVVACARDVQHLMTDPRSVAALDIAERHAKGEATDSELAAAGATAWDAASTSTSTATFTSTTAAARAVARAVAWAARAAAWDAAIATALATTPWDAAAWAAARETQRAHFIRIFGAAND